jgi:hypothetical protein
MQNRAVQSAARSDSLQANGRYVANPSTNSMRRVPNGLNELAAARADLIAPLLRSHVLPLFRADENNNPEFVATGVPVYCEGRPFLVSAAHVFDKMPPNGVFLLLENDPKSALADLPRLTIAPDARSRNSDLLDIGSVSLTDSESNALGSESFVELVSRLRTVHSKWAKRCLLLGYPDKDQWRDVDVAEYHLKQSYYNAPEVRDSLYGRAGLDSGKNIVIDFNRRLIQGPKGRGGRPNFFGMSGGGIWEFDVHEDYSSSSKPQLIGLLAGPAPKNNKVLFGANVDALIEHLRGT